MLAATGWLWLEAEKSRSETVRSLAHSLYQLALGKIPQDDEVGASLERKEVPSDESAREAMALLAEAIRLNPDHRPAMAAFSNLIHQRAWPLPVLAVPHVGFFSDFSPRFAGFGRWLITHPPDAEPEKLVILEMEPNTDPLEISMDAGEKLQCFAAAKSGTSLFIGTKQNKVYVYDLKNESIKDEVKLEEIPLWLACSDDGSRLAIGGERGVIKLFTYKDDKVSEVQTRVDGTVRSLAMEASGGWLATLSATGKLWAWKCEPGGLVSIPIEASLEASSSMAALSFHGNPTVLAVGSRSGVRLFDLQTGGLVGGDSSFETRSFFTSPLGDFLAWGRERQKPDDWKLVRQQDGSTSASIIGRGLVPDLAAAVLGLRF